MPRCEHLVAYVIPCYIRTTHFDIGAKIIIFENGRCCDYQGYSVSKVMTLPTFSSYIKYLCEVKNEENALSNYSITELRNIQTTHLSK